jgi:hypothetical protein
LPNVPRHPGKRYAIQAAIGLVAIAIGGLGYIIRNHFAQNPVHWLVGGAGLVGLGFILWRHRHHRLMGILLALLQAFFRRKKPATPGSSPSQDFDFDPSDFGRPGNNDRPSPGGKPGSGGASGNATRYPATQTAAKKTAKPAEEAPPILHIGMIRKLEDLRDDPRTSEAERQNARALLERHVKSLKRKGGRK